ncbi:MAG: efflux transporter outer membrane subunit [Deltaproteobacteria bacterium]|nr:efflux transporter outer membrane subunit [Deltaproteobacteria bacterium]
MIRHKLHILALVCLTGCSTMAPKYSQPAPPVPAEWIAASADRNVAVKSVPQVADIPWQEFITERKMQKLIELALSNNRDLKVAALTVERYRSLYQIQRNELLPRVDATAGASLQQIPADLSGTGKSRTVEQYNIGLGVSSYELDLFGRVRSLKEQALEQYLSTGHAQRSVRISLVSQVAVAYLALAADREHLQLAKETLANQREAYKLVKSRFDAGITNQLALNQAQTTVDSARVDIARFTTQVAQDENALALLAGSALPAELLPDSLSGNYTALNDVSPGLSSEVLLKRPDILQAESQLKSANASIGAAEAALFPRITLVSSVGLGSDELAGLFKGGAFAWSFAPRISLPIFDGGSNTANLKVSEVDRDIAVARYEKAIQTAFREVADSLAQRATIDEQLAAQKSLADAAEESCRLSQARFDKGVDSYLTVLDSQRTLYGAQQNLITARLTRLANMVTLYKALGGGTGR